MSSPEPSVSLPYRFRRKSLSADDFDDLSMPFSSSPIKSASSYSSSPYSETAHRTVTPSRATLSPLALPRIQSSPRYGSEVGACDMEYDDDHSPSWSYAPHPHSSSSTSAKRVPAILSTYRRSFSSDDEPPLTSDFDASEFSEDMSVDLIDSPLREEPKDRHDVEIVHEHEPENGSLFGPSTDRNHIYAKSDPIDINIAAALLDLHRQPRLLSTSASSYSSSISAHLSVSISTLPPQVESPKPKLESIQQEQPQERHIHIPISSLLCSPLSPAVQLSRPPLHSRPSGLTLTMPSSSPTLPPVSSPIPPREESIPAPEEKNVEVTSQNVDEEPLASPLSPLPPSSPIPSDAENDMEVDQIQMEHPSTDPSSEEHGISTVKSEPSDPESIPSDSTPPLPTIKFEAQLNLNITLHPTPTHLSEPTPDPLPRLPSPDAHQSHSPSPKPKVETEEHDHAETSPVDTEVANSPLLPENQEQTEEEVLDVKSVRSTPLPVSPDAEQVKCQAPVEEEEVGDSDEVKVTALEEMVKDEKIVVLAVSDIKIEVDSDMELESDVELGESSRRSESRGLVVKKVGREKRKKLVGGNGVEREGPARKRVKLESEERENLSQEKEITPSNEEEIAPSKGKAKKAVKRVVKKGAADRSQRDSKSADRPIRDGTSPEMEKCGVDEKSSGSKPRSKGKNKKRCRVTSDDNSEDGGVGVERRSVDPAEKKSSAVCTTPRLENRHAELEGLLIETFATSRASSMPPSSLYRTVVASRPALKSQRDKNEWIEVIGDVLEEARKRCGVFERVESSGKDDSDRPLESRWFYVPEKDEDQERAELIRSMMPRLDKRSETKKYKQYYWRPLDKISRWDAEDEM